MTSAGPRPRGGGSWQGTMLLRELPEGFPPAVFRVGVDGQQPDAASTPDIRIEMPIVPCRDPDRITRGECRPLPYEGHLVAWPDRDDSQPKSRVFQRFGLDFRFVPLYTVHSCTFPRKMLHDAAAGSP